MFRVPRVCTRDNILKEFQFKILHRYLPTNDLLFKMEKVNSRKCTFCNLYIAFCLAKNVNRVKIDSGCADV